MDDKDFIRAVKPTLFNATFHPEVIIGVLLANLMLETTEILGSHAIHAPGPFTSETDRIHALTKLHHYVNGRFSHVRPVDFAKIWGLHERENIKDPEALAANDYTMKILSRAYYDIPQFQSRAHLLEGFLDTGLFPEYVYPTVNTVLRLSEKIPQAENHPLGITSCADECILIASLAFIRQCCDLEDIVMLGSPLHYVLFLFPACSEGFFFNGKREFFTYAAWHEDGPGQKQESRRETFMEKMFFFDRLITSSGYCIFPLRKGNIKRSLLTCYLEKINTFLGFRLQDLSEDIEKGIRVLPDTESTDVPLLIQLNRARQAVGIKKTMREYGIQENNMTAISSWLTARWMDIPNPDFYVKAALTGYKVWLESASILNLSDAVETVRKIPGRDGVFSSPQRIGLPDEALIFQTAHDHERVLLLYSLLMLSEAIPDQTKETFRIIPVPGHWAVEAYGKRLSGQDL